jgi:hypothetical protein
MYINEYGNRDLTGPLSAMEQSLLIQYEMEIKKIEQEKKAKKDAKKVQKLEGIKEENEVKGTHVYIYVYVYIYIHMYIYVYTYVYICIYIY